MFESIRELETHPRPSGPALAATLLIHLAIAAALWVLGPRLSVGDGSGLPLTVSLPGDEALRAARGFAGRRPESAAADEIPPWAWPAAALPAAPPRPVLEVSEGSATGVAQGAVGLTGLADPSGGDITAPEVVRRTIPEYPADARLQGKAGSVVVETEIDEDGNPGAPRVVRGLSETLDAAALAAVAQWRFKPARQHGRPVRVLFRVTVDFRL
jgi:TonB family protein